MFRAIFRMRREPTLVVAGGVAANRAIGSALTELAESNGFAIRVPPPKYCTDNAAMIAWAGLERFALGKRDPLDVSPRARWPLDTIRRRQRTVASARTALRDDQDAGQGLDDEAAQFGAGLGRAGWKERS